MLEDTTNGKLYICTAADTVTPSYTWEEVGGGGGSSITELTSADYNYPETGIKTAVALWLLPQGEYVAGEGINIQRGTAYAGTLNTGDYLWVRENLNGGTSTVSFTNGSWIFSSANSSGYSEGPRTGLATNDISQTTGTSTTSVMSQNATTSMVYADPATLRKIKIGASTSTSQGADSIEVGYLAAAAADNGVAIGRNAGNGSAATGGVSIGVNANTNGVGQIALGATSGSNDTTQGVMSIGPSNTYYGYNSSNYRLLTGLYDPQSAHDAATKGYVDTSITTAISGVVGVEFEVVQTLPATGDAGTIYLVPNQGTTPNIYDEYIYVNNAFEKIGTTEIDLSNYVTTTDLNTALANYTTTANLATVATTGDYNDLTNIPAIFTTNEWNALWA